MSKFMIEVNSTYSNRDNENIRDLVKSAINLADGLAVVQIQHVLEGSITDVFSLPSDIARGKRVNNIDIQNLIELLILLTPTGELRNKLCDANLEVMSIIQKEKDAKI